MAHERSTPALPCPECRFRNVTGLARIGNQRSKCVTCNNFAQNVRRLVLKRLKENHAEEFEQLRLQAERDLYPQVMEDWINAH